MFLTRLLTVLVLALPVVATAQPTSTTSEVLDESDVEEGEVEVDFDDEEEVTFAEEVDRGAFDSTPLVPEYDERPWLSVLPVLCALVVAWNVRFKPGQRRHARSKKKA